MKNKQALVLAFCQLETFNEPLMWLLFWRGGALTWRSFQLWVSVFKEEAVAFVSYNKRAASIGHFYIWCSSVFLLFSKREGKASSSSSFFRVKKNVLSQYLIYSFVFCFIVLQFPKFRFFLKKKSFPFLKGKEWQKCMMEKEGI